MSKIKMATVVVKYFDVEGSYDPEVLDKAIKEKGINPSSIINIQQVERYTTAFTVYYRED